MAPFAKSLLNLLRADSNDFTGSLRSLRNKALHSNARGWEKLAREFGKDQSDSNTIPVIQLLFEAVVHKSLQMPSTMAASSHTTSRMKTEATRPAVPLLDALDHCCMNLIHLHGTPGWCVSGGSLLLGVLNLVSTQWHHHHTRMEDVPLESLQRLLQHCRALEWTGLDCFLVMKQTQELGYAPLSEQLQDFPVDPVCARHTANEAYRTTRKVENGSQLVRTASGWVHGVLPASVHLHRGDV